MATVRKAEAFLVDIEVEQVRTDAVQAFLSQETVFVELTTDDGAVGVGYTYTIGTGGTAVLALLRDHLLLSLVGADATGIEAVWHDLFASTRATTVGAITSLALAAVDTALWDLRCLRAGEPLWRVAGGFRSRFPLYDAETGWLHLDTDQLVAGALGARDEGWRGVKVKIGKPSGAGGGRRLAGHRAVHLAGEPNPGRRPAGVADLPYTMDVAIIRAVFIRCLDAPQLAGIDDGWLQEWSADLPKHDPKHRRLSQLVTVYPLGQIDAEATPELLEAAAKLMDRRGHGAMGWSWAWKIALRARLGDGETVRSRFWRRTGRWVTTGTSTPRATTGSGAVGCRTCSARTRRSRSTATMASWPASRRFWCRATTV
ncbi:hypothetical protein [Kutzneria buriramensis]|uniref:Mandelate racemase/muconate lactonizing enzyme-like protein n=1 Tax=Kutzneria buriramensis TaxID=1045776 RepID=A0A3E0H2W7_9PSEU|nr:hypothetical protein [Kutzneria buriramensis]REH36370.1 mandelate racemase/muconate lactonizing enzyme-like protein [Kutzneria buriramensis]